MTVVLQRRLVEQLVGTYLLNHDVEQLNDKDCWNRIRLTISY